MRNVAMVSFNLLLVLFLVCANRSTKSEAASMINDGAQPFSYHVKALKFLLSQLGEQHVWPEMEIGWRIIVGTLIGIFGAACGSVGGVGGGGIFVPMLILIIGFDAKSATAISKCMVTGAAISTLFFNLKQKHPTHDIPIIDYDLLLLFQPLQMLGISIGVVLSIIFADWMLTVLLIIIFIGTSIKAFFKGVETWTKETMVKEEAVKLLESIATSSGEEEYKCLPDSPDDGPQKETKKAEGTILSNIRWKEFGFLSFVWFAILVLQIALTYTTSCSTTYWILTFLQIPVSLGVSLYQAVVVYKKWRITAPEQDHGTRLPLHLLILSAFGALLAGIFGGLLGVGSGFVMGPLFIELGLIPQVASATATFGMSFTASISVAQYFLFLMAKLNFIFRLFIQNGLKKSIGFSSNTHVSSCFAALYLTLVATVAAYIGQKIIDKLINFFQRASLIIFVLSFTIFFSTIVLGGVGISDMTEKIARNEYMGFEDLCN